jgi:selenophosphate synthetase-related protein
VPGPHVAAVLDAFARRDVAAADIGAVTADRVVRITDQIETETIWDFSSRGLIGCGPSTTTPSE